MSDNLNEFIDKIVEESRKDIHFPYKELDFQLNLVEKVKKDADKKLEDINEGDIPEWTIFYYNLALIIVISGFEFFFRELILNEKILNHGHKEKYYNAEEGRFKKNFQNYKVIKKFLKDEFGIDIETKLGRVSNQLKYQCKKLQQEIE